MQNLNKIVVIHTSTGMGGAEYSLFEFLRYLENTPTEVHILLSSTIKTTFKEKIRGFSHFHSTELIYIKKHSSVKSYIHDFISLITSNFSIYRLVKKQKIKIIYCNTFRSLPHCLLTKLISRTTIICHCRDNVTTPYIRYFIKFGSHQCIAVSAWIKSQIISSHPVKIIYNGINIPSFSFAPPTGWLHKKLHLAPEVKIIANIGQIVDWKNQKDYLLIANELIKKEHNLHFLLIGNIVNKSYYYQIQQLIFSLGLQPFITLTGHVEDTKKYIFEITLLLHTAISEPFGRVIVEAAAAMKPVVSYSSGGPLEIIKNGETGFLVPNKNIHNMVESVQRLLEDNCLCETMGRAAHTHVSRYFDNIQYAHNLYNFLFHDSYSI